MDVDWYTIRETLCSPGFGGSGFRIKVIGFRV
jgi:hypothetical protein